MSEITLKPQTEQKTLPLVAAQPGIWIADQLSPYSNAYAVAHFVELRGALNSALLSRAIIAGMQEADTLNMAFGELEGEPLQWPEPQAFREPEVIDLRDAADPEAAARALMQQDMTGDLRVLSGAPLYHHSLFRLDEDHWYWYQRYHHLVVDGFSFTALTRRIANLYSAWQRGDTPEPSPFVPFSDVVDEYQRYQQSSGWQRDRQFWLEKGAQLPAPASLSALPLAGQSASTDLLRHTFAVDRDTFQALLTHTGQHNLSAADTAFALVALWLARLTGQHAFAAGFIFMRRIGSAALCATGPVINVLPMAVHYDPAQPLTALAGRLAGEVKKMRRHQRYDAEQVQRDLGRSGDSDPLYGPVINLKMFDYQLDFAGIKGITHQLASGPVRDLEIAIYLSEQGDLTLELLANAQRYSDTTLKQHASRFGLLLQQLAVRPASACGELDMLMPEEHQQLAAINQTAVMLPAETLSSLLLRQAQRSPRAPALADEGHQLDYQQMQQQVAALGQQLIAQGVTPGDIVAVALPRSVFLSLALQAIVSVGATWLPLDTGYPDDRLQMMLEDAAPKTLITFRELAERLAALSPVAPLFYDALLTPVDSVLMQAPRPQDGAYIIYTSGSTGRPKGVLVSHEAIVNRLLWMQDRYPLGSDDVVLQKTPSSFDVSVWEFFWPLIVGARLVMAPPDAHRDPDALQQLFARYRVTTTHFVPSMLAAFVASLQEGDAIARCATLRRVFCSGEALPAELSRQWQALTRVPLHNLYGPTEAAVDVSYYPAFGPELAAVEGASVPIGFPVWNTGLRILDARLQPVPPGVAGDLYLTGVQLAHGYLDRPDLTASRFVADPWGHGSRMYRTGDVARWLPDGAVEYLGRSDDQLKIRGQRIELNEIDHAMAALPGIEQAVTHAVVLGSSSNQQGDARQLVGYVVADGPIDTDAMRQTLATQLPTHMVPVAIVQLAALPLSSNGKLDRKALPLPQTQAALAGRAPHPGLETTLAQAFARLLECEPVSAQDDFFSLGGHSLLAMRLAAQLRRTLNQPVSVGQIMVASTVEKLAKLLSSEPADVARAGFEAVLPLRRSTGPTLFCFHPASGFAWQFSVLQRYLDARWSLLGIQSPDTASPLNQAQHLDAVCEAHLATVRQQQPQGPYYFLGYSLGGTLAQGIAARLEAEGETVAFLGLLDTWPPETQNWDERRGENVLDPAVLEEVNREREQFIAAQRQQAGEGMEALFTTIEANYASSVRLLATARSARFTGHATLFLAEQTQQPGQDARRAWAPYVGELTIWPLDCAHVEIISPRMFEQIGPRLQQCLASLNP
ncbi:enterobactin synthase subunit F [Pantoea agglomerans]|uniref:enterobactin synthase subunit F n=1 Tax=Enterobacter agglomerans TaxID=549 RepID=UPI0028A0E540|nr:enterobactin synthase subunit F [Pantoea agglomerans]WNK48461.1 enterobactin synthase subunit F [Pantoea agglomerans]